MKSQPDTKFTPTGVSKPPRKLQFTLDSKNIRLILSGCILLSITAFICIGFFGISILDAKSKKMVELKVNDQTADAQLSNLEKSKKEVASYAYFKNVASQVIPSDKDQAQDIVEINNMASESGIAIQSITFPASSLGSTTTLGTQDATTSSSAKNAISQATPVSGIPGLYSLALTITPDSNPSPDKVVTYAKLLDFLNRVENNRHTAQITNVSITPAVNSSNPSVSNGITFTLIINIFIKP